MLAADFIEPTTLDKTRRFGRWFSVVEEAKGRRRGIFWPRDINEAKRFVGAHDMGLEFPIEDILGAAVQVNQKGMWATTYDLKISFNQCSLAPEVRAYFVFRTQDGRLFRLTRMPMGDVTAPNTMHAITAALAKEAAEEEPGVSFWVHVDNVRFVSASKAAVMRVSDRFVTLCEP